MTTFLALYRGQTVTNAQVVAVTSDPELVGMVAQTLLEHEDDTDETDRDPILEALYSGRRNALRLVHGAAE